MSGEHFDTLQHRASVTFTEAVEAMLAGERVCRGSGHNGKSNPWIWRFNEDTQEFEKGQKKTASDPEEFWWATAFGAEEILGNDWEIIRPDEVSTCPTVEEVEVHLYAFLRQHISTPHPLILAEEVIATLRDRWPGMFRDECAANQEDSTS